MFDRPVKNKINCVRRFKKKLFLVVTRLEIIFLFNPRRVTWADKTVFISFGLCAIDFKDNAQITNFF